MTRRIVLAAGAAIAAALAASPAAVAQEPNTIGTVTVKADLGDVKDANALDYWPTITGDLEAAIRAKAGPLVSEDGYAVTVSLSEVSLSGSELLTGQGEFNRLGGWVYFRPEGEAVPQDQQNIVIEARTAPVPADAIAVIVPDKPDFYAAMLDGFATATLDRLSALNGGN